MGLPRDGAALRDRMQRSGNLIVLGVLKVTGIKPDHGGVQCFIHLERLTKGAYTLSI